MLLTIPNYLPAHFWLGLSVSWPSRERTTVSSAGMDPEYSMKEMGFVAKHFFLALRLSPLYSCWGSAVPGRVERGPRSLLLAWMLSTASCEMGFDAESVVLFLDARRARLGVIHFPSHASIPSDVVRGPQSP